MLENDDVNNISNIDAQNNLNEGIAADNLNEQPSSFEKKQIEKQRTDDASAKVVDMGIKAAATFFGGPSATKIVNTLQKTPVLNKAYDHTVKKYGKQVGRVARFTKTDKFLKDADDSGLLDTANNVMDAMGGNPSSGGKTGLNAKNVDLEKLTKNLSSKNKFSKKKDEDKNNIIQKGIKNFWKKLPPMVKLYIIGGIGLLSLLLLVIAFVSAFNPLQLIFLNEQESADKYKEEFYLFCGTEEECTTYEWFKNGKLLSDQVRFYTKLNLLVNHTDIASWDNEMEKNRIKAIIVTTLSLDLSFDEFVAGEDGAFGVNDNLKFWNEVSDWFEGSQFSKDMDDIDRLYVQFLVYAPVCTYDDDGVKRQEYMKKADGTIHQFNWWEQVVLERIYNTDGLVNKLIGLINNEDGFSITAHLGISDALLELSGVSKETIDLKRQCEAKDHGTFSIEHSTTNEISEMNYWDYLLNTDYLETRETLRPRYAEYAVHNGLDINNLSTWSEKDLKSVRAEIISDIKTTVDSYYDVQKGDVGNQAFDIYSSNGITVEGVGTMSLDDYVMGVLYGEFGNIIIGQPEAAKVAAIAVRTFALENTNYLSRAIGNGETVQVYKEVPTSYSGYNELKQAVESTRGEILVNSSGKASGGHYITIPIGEHRKENDDNTVTMYMQGYPGNEATNYSYTMSWADIHRVAASSGGLYEPTDDKHHWGISVYALREMAENGLSYKEIISQTYGVGGVLTLQETVYHTEVEGLVLNNSSTFWMRYSPADPISKNPFYDFARFNYGECAWYAMERADEIMSTMGWYKTKAWIANDGVGGNGGDYCSHPAYANYNHYTDTSNPMTFRPGYLISWASGQYGHVAVIEDVVGDKVTISEAWATNPGIGHQSIRTVSMDELITYHDRKQFICTIDLSSGRD